MYNYFAHQKSFEKLKKKQEEQQNHLRLHEKNRKKKQMLVVKYQERALRKIANKYNEQQEGIYDRKVRLSYANADNCNLGPKGFYFRHRSQKNRILELMKKNQIFDPVPFTMDFSPRYREKSCDRSFQYTSNNDSMRIYDAVKNMRTNQLSNSWNLDLPSRRFNETCTSKFNSTKQNQNERIKDKKNILPELNMKKYPKSFATLVNETPFGPLRNVKNTSSLHINNQRLILQRQKLQKEKNFQKEKERKIKFNTIHITDGSEEN